MGVTPGSKTDIRGTGSTQNLNQKNFAASWSTYPKGCVVSKMAGTCKSPIRVPAIIGGQAIALKRFMTDKEIFGVVQLAITAEIE